ncbi:unnamed protein product [Nippostrongylus brasiliensis]|uniref:Uncharacterized protein n=1 Tax=Nippostrongylus brasiliensis TaxID=27835 RepID=A0A0N4YG12_NIPBR|nr:unnamed protein product [Nippostrongylus brasiliensis]
MGWYFNGVVSYTLPRQIGIFEWYSSVRHEVVRRHYAVVKNRETNRSTGVHVVLKIEDLG